MNVACKTKKIVLIKSDDLLKVESNFSATFHDKRNSRIISVIRDILKILWKVWNSQQKLFTLQVKAGRLGRSVFFAVYISCALMSVRNGRKRLDACHSSLYKLFLKIWLNYFPNLRKRFFCNRVNYRLFYKSFISKFHKKTLQGQR